jgi:hypothetical protein
MKIYPFVFSLFLATPASAQDVVSICREASSLASSQGELLVELWERMARLETMFNLAAAARGSDDWNAANTVLADTLDTWRSELVLPASTNLGETASQLNQLCTSG